MPPPRRSLELDAGRVFRWSFVAAFLMLEWLTWRRIGRWLARRPVRPGPFGRVPIARLMIGASWRAAFGATVLAGGATLAALLLVKLVLEPMLDLWLRPAYDPGSWMFYLAAGEKPMASMPARWKSGARWRPGALVRTNRRYWFMPASWDLEPWCLACGEVERVRVQAPALARLLPVRHWPDQLLVRGRGGEETAFAPADPAAVLGWFAPTCPDEAEPPGPRVAPQGAFDA